MSEPVSGPEPLGNFCASLTDQHFFSRLSGDFNPIHLDALRARRTFFGEPIAHGMHLALAALEAFLTARPVAPGRPITRLSGVFKSPALLDRDLPIQCLESDACGVRLIVGPVDDPALNLRIDFGPGGAALPLQGSVQEVESWPISEPQDPPWDELEGFLGQLEWRLGERAFPAITEHFGLRLVALLAGISRIVGMQCPGWRSILSDFDLHFSEEWRPGSVGLRTAQAIERFSRLTLELSGSGLTGRITAFHRPGAVDQPEMDAVTDAVEPGITAGQRALVIGGSRGLGELVAKIVAAGGGRVLATYRHGLADAERVAAEIQAAGGDVEVAQLDTDSSADRRRLVETGFAPTHLYYFATPKIFRPRSSRFDWSLFNEFSASYLRDFQALCEAFAGSEDAPLRVFLPSTVALDQPLPDLLEYAAAKGAAEVLAEHLTRFQPGVVVMTRRLPRLATDQTSTLLPVPSAPALPLMIEVVRAMGRGE